MSKKAEHNVVKIIYVLGLVLLSLYLISPFLTPIIFAGTVALAMYPLQMHLEQKGVKRKLAAGFLTTTFAVVISIPFSFFLAKGTIAVTQQLEKFQTDVRYKNQGVQSIIQTIKYDFMNAIQRTSERFGLDLYLTDQRLDYYLVKVNSSLLKFFQDIASSLPTVFLFFLVMIVCTYSFLKHAGGVRSFFQNMLGFKDEKMEELIKIFITDSRQVYVTNIVTGGVQSLIVATGVWALGLGDFFLVFFITLILSFIPVIGAAPVAFTFGAIAFFKGEPTAAVIIVIVGAFTGVMDNFLRPYLASLGESRIPPIAAFICVIGGAILFGFPGLFIGLLVGSFAYDTLPFFWEELGGRQDRNNRPEVIPLASPIDEHPPKTH
jgi:predicted PurR-regulated permease PerM